MGLSWAHVLGDAFSAADFVNAWGQVMSGQYPRQPKLAQSHIETERSLTPTKKLEDPISVKRVGPVGDHWISASNRKMEVFSFHTTPRMLSELQSKVRGPVFESLCGLIWKIVAQIRNGPGPKLVTICKNGPKGRRNSGVPSNGQVISVVKADFSVTEADPKELAKLVMNRAADERHGIEEAMERDQGLSDFVIYGSNLTFVDWGEADFYGLEVKGEKPIHVNYTIDGIGDEGAVLLLPGPPEGDGGKIVTLIVPENEVAALKSELKREFNF